MKRIHLQQNSAEWEEWRRSKITGSKLKDVLPSDNPLKADVIAECEAQKLEFKKTWSIPYLMELLPPESVESLKSKIPNKIGFYEVLAERLSLDSTPVDNPMERGHELEQEAVDAFSEETGHKVNTDSGVWVSDISDSIALSPDGEIDDEHAVEIKCLSSAKHLQALIEKKIPKEYEEQIMQYFVVNEKLEQLFFVFYDPRIAAKPMHYQVIERSDIKDKIEASKAEQLRLLKKIDELVADLTF